MTQTSINYGIVLYELSVPQEAAETSPQDPGRSQGTVKGS